MPTLESSLVTDTSIKAYFHTALADASRNQSVCLDEMTSAYVINLLSTQLSNHALKTTDCSSRHHQALALLLAEANDQQSPQQRNQLLQRLGDVALFIAGIFADSLNRKPVDVDYYIAMGETAYASLYVTMSQRHDRFSRAELFAGLAQKFAALVDVLCEVSENSGLKSNADVLRTYEVWARSGSERAKNQLQRQGIYPLNNNPTPCH